METRFSPGCTLVLSLLKSEWTIGLFFCPFCPFLPSSSVRVWVCGGVCVCVCVYVCGWVCGWVDECV